MLCEGFSYLSVTRYTYIEHHTKSILFQYKLTNIIGAVRSGKLVGGVTYHYYVTGVDV